MKRTTGKSLLLALALLHLLADVAFAGGAVLCVGPDDHLAIESEHVAEAGCGTEVVKTASSTEPSISASDATGADCTDSPLHSDAELFSSSDEELEPAPLGLSAPAWAAHDGFNTSRLRPSARAPDTASAIRAHRTTVLII